MKYLIAVLIFCLVLFFYLHVYFHLKTSNDLEVYTIERPSKEKLEEICDLRQPIMFQFMNEEMDNTLTLDTINAKYNAFDIKIRDNTDKTSSITEMYLPIILGEGAIILKNDKEGKFFTETNSDFLKETGLTRVFRYNDLFLRPLLVSRCMYDFCSGSTNSFTPLRYNLNYRNYYYVTRGSIRIQLMPPSASKYLRPEQDYDNFEFYSPMNPWNIQDEYKREFNKIKSLEVCLKQNDIIFIPAYWWYSIKYEQVSSVCVFQYRTYMNTVAILPTILMSTLQTLNTKHEVVEKIQNKGEEGENSIENEEKNMKTGETI